MTRLLGQLTTLLLYGASPVVVALAPFAVVPAVTTRFGADGWAVCAVALSVGAAVAVVAELGWVVVGPQRVSRDPRRHAEIHHDALASRLVALVVLAPVAVVAVTLLVDEHRGAAVLLTLGVAAGALSPTWLFVGLGRPGLTLLCEALPRVVLALAAAGVIALGGPLGRTDSPRCSPSRSRWSSPRGPWASGSHRPASACWPCRRSSSGSSS